MLTANRGEKKNRVGVQFLTNTLSQTSKIKAGQQNYHDVEKKVQEGTTHLPQNS